jgi:hypothetical protein
MVGPRCFCAHGLRVEKGVQSVTVVRALRGNSRAAQQRRPWVPVDAAAQRAGKNKAKENMRRGLPFDAVQSTAAKTPNYLTIPKRSTGTKRPKTQL